MISKDGQTQYPYFTSVLSELAIHIHVYVLIQLDSLVDNVLLLLSTQNVLSIEISLT